MTEDIVGQPDRRAALERVLASSEFAGAERLRAFLDYVVAQDLAGRADKILGKTILEDVYRKGPALDGTSETVVRVDATRLRQRLEIYYGNEGRDDPVRIHIDKGGYVPRFEFRGNGGTETQDGPRPPVPARSGHLAAGAVVIGLAVMGLAAGVNWFGAGETPEETSPEARSALFEDSPTALLARNMVSQARELLFPAAELVRVSSALDMFEEAMRLDPSYFGGFAGASQASSLLAGLARDPGARSDHLEKAAAYAEQALALDRTKAFSHSSMALVQLIRRDFEGATQSSRLAVMLEPDNLGALEIDAIIAVFSGDFERAIQSADPELHEERVGRGLPWRNALGNAYFHAGAYDLSIEALQKAVRSGQPVSEINTAHLIASYQASGQGAAAAELVAAFQKSWPQSRVAPVLRRLFRDPQHADAVIAQMHAAGWVDPAAN